MSTPVQTLAEAQAHGIILSLDSDGDLCFDAPVGAMTLALKKSLKEHKAAIMAILALPVPACPGEELEQLRREIGEMARAEHEQWVYSDELDPRWPPSAKVYKRLSRKEVDHE